MSATARASKGAALLDRRGPTDWALRVRLDDFDVSRASLCVLAQVYGEYGTGTRRLGVFGGTGAHDSGFDSYLWFSPLLNRAWQKEIRSRQAIARVRLRNTVPLKPVKKPRPIPRHRKLVGSSR